MLETRSQSACLDDSLETYSVSRLGAEIDQLLRAALPEVWVVGEIQRLRLHASGHLYFELIEKGEGDALVGKLDAVVWRSDRIRIEALLARLGDRMSEGMRLRCRARLSFYPPQGRLQLQVREIDPSFSLGELARRRAETLEELARRGLLDRNRNLELSELPLRLGLVTSIGSAAYHDFVATLAESGYPFRVIAVHAAVQGREAEREIPAALARLGRLADLDAVVLIRGGGAKSDLVAFDSRTVAFAVAECPVPVLSGLGHEIDLAIADRVSHRSFKTPTAVAEFLVGKATEQEARLTRLRERLARATRGPLERWRSHLELARERVRSRARAVGIQRIRVLQLVRTLEASVQRALAFRSARLTERRHALHRAGVRRLEASAYRQNLIARRLREAADRRLERERLALAARERLAAGLAPDRTLRRGFSITRGPDGRALLSPAGLEPGLEVTTQLASGGFKSRVSERI